MHMTDFIGKTNQIYGSLTRTQKQVADYLLKHLDTVAFKKLDELSLEIGVSTTSVIRFARSLGYSGYADMQQDLQQSLIGKASLPERLNESIKNTKQDKLLIDTFQNDIDNIHATLMELSEEDLLKSVSAIVGAKSVYVLGNRGAFSVAHYLAYRLGQIKKGVRLIQGIGMMFPEEIINAGEGDICIAILTPRYTKMTASIISWLKKRKVLIILFTKQGSVEIEPYGDIILPSYTKGVSYKSSFVSLFCICNYLLAAVALQDHDNAMDVLAQTEEVLSGGYYLGL